MRSESNTDLKVGLTVLIGIALLLAGIGWAKGWKFGADTHTLYAHFENAGGIEVGDPVYIHGIKNGKVKEINSLSGKEVDITMDIDKMDTLHKDASAEIMMAELMGGKKIEINAGSIGKLNWEKDTLNGHFTGDISTLVALLTSISGSLPSITKNLDSVLGNLTDFFGNGKFKEKTYSAIEQAGQTLKDLHNVLSENRDALKRTIDQADVLTRELNSTIVSVRPGALALVDSMRTFLRKASGTLSGADELLAHLNEMMAASKDKKSLLYRLTSDKEMAMKLDSLLDSGHKLIEQIRLQGVDANIRFFQSTKPVK